MKIHFQVEDNFLIFSWTRFNFHNEILRLRTWFRETRIAQNAIFKMSNLNTRLAQMHEKHWKEYYRECSYLYLRFPRPKYVFHKKLFFYSSQCSEDLIQWRKLYKYNHSCNVSTNNVLDKATRTENHVDYRRDKI